jgi:hypothetical protein
MKAKWKQALCDAALIGFRFDHAEECNPRYRNVGKDKWMKVTGCRCAAGPANKMLNEIADKLNGGGIPASEL